MTHENELWPEDQALFEKLEGQYLTPEEGNFFEIMHSKMLDENAPWPETLVWEHDNPDHIYLLRQGYDEFMIGRGTNRNEWQRNEVHVMNLSEALNTNLKETGILNQDVTLLDWLRNNNYQFVCFDHTNDGNKL